MTDHGSLDSVREWWRTSIIDIAPGSIRVRGYAIEDLIGEVSFSDMIWLMLRGELASAHQSALLAAALVAAVDHGPQAPSIAIARMATTCGVAINNAMASAVNALGDVHGGAGKQAMEIYQAIDQRVRAGASVVIAAEAEIARRLGDGQMIEGFGHRFHGVDPRAVRLLDLLDAAAAQGAIEGRFTAIARAVEAELATAKGQRLAMNIDGATATVLCELGFGPDDARGLFILSRSVGILAHAREQSIQGGRIKGPMPPSVPYLFEGAAPRALSMEMPTLGYGRAE